MRICRNELSFREPTVRPSKVVFAFSDSSLYASGFFITDVDGNILGTPVSVLDSAEDIYELESEYATLAILEGWKWAPFVMLGCDNMDTVLSFQRRHSARQSVCDRIMRPC